MQDLHFEQPVVIVAPDDARTRVLLRDERRDLVRRGLAAALSRVELGTPGKKAALVHIHVHLVPAGLQLELPPRPAAVGGVGFLQLMSAH